MEFGMRRNILIAASLLILVLMVALSLKRSGDTGETEGEIRHFQPEKPEKELRLSNGQTVEEYFEQSIHRSDRIRHQRTGQTTKQSLPNKTHPSYPTGVMLTHSVVPGDTFAKLAEQYHVSAYQIRKRNHLAPGDGLKVGQKLKIIPGEQASYRVRPGDNLIRIGKRFGVDHREIIRLNHLDTERAIWVGEKLLMPVSQKKIDEVLAAMERKKQEALKRKKRYERELLARLARQKLARERLAKARAQKKAQAKKEKQARLERAKRAFKYTEGKRFRHKVRVVATAYTSHRSQTDGTPFLAAWNNRIRPGMKIIAVSPDLIRKYGITNGVRVKIAGLPGTYVVRDKMNARLHNHIDIYMGVNRSRALRWGRRRVVMYW